MTDINVHAQQKRKTKLQNKRPVVGLDPFVEGAKKLDKFWPIYVKEADSYDKELSEGWNRFGALLAQLSFIILIICVAILLVCLK